jgi:pimeloyl-ACP methyl ester carboxylesterase
MARRRALALLALPLLVPLGAAGKPASNPPWQSLPLPPAMPSADAQGHIEVGEAQIYYASYGKGEPVILLHGGLGNADHFAFQVPALADKFRVIVIDSRGQGRSTLSKSKLSYHVMASDVIAVMDALQIEKASFVGWSDGGEIALDIAINKPDRVAKLFVFGSNYDANGSKSRRGPQAPTFTAYSAKCHADYMKMAKDPKAYDAVVDALLPVWRNPAGFTKAQLRTIKAPTLVADGDHDEIIELDQVKEMSTLIPNAQLVVFRNTSHFALWQDPSQFNKALVDFLTK